MWFHFTHLFPPSARVSLPIWLTHKDGKGVESKSTDFSLRETWVGIPASPSLPSAFGSTAPGIRALCCAQERPMGTLVHWRRLGVPEALHF